MRESGVGSPMRTVAVRTRQVAILRAVHDAPPEILEFIPVQFSKWRIIFGGLGPTALCWVIGGVVVLFPGARGSAFTWAYFAALIAVVVVFGVIFPMG